MIVKEVIIEKFRSFDNVRISLGKRITVISGRNATQKTTLLGLISQPFSISSEDPLYGCRTIDGYNFRSQFNEKFKISTKHDVIGSHRWTLELYDNRQEIKSYTMESIARKQKGKPDTLRFWNAKSRSRGSGYIQRPVYYLSLSRLFPIGESGKTKPVNFSLSSSELSDFIKSYREILSINYNSNGYRVSVEKGTSSRSFAGVCDDVHDLLTNSAGEGNVARILLAVLSFKRLKQNYKDYAGGILLIDEIDATLFGFSQRKLINFLDRAALECKLQIIVTTHSPIILEEVYSLLRKEIQKKGGNLPPGAYENSIIYLQPEYNTGGGRKIIAKEVHSRNDLLEVIDDINLKFSNNKSKLNLYCEDGVASLFLKVAFQVVLNIDIERYLSIQDIDLGWANYLQLIKKGVGEFLNNIVALDGDVPQKEEFTVDKKLIVDKCKNVIFLPLVVERDTFALLKQHGAFNEFKKGIKGGKNFSYDMCFSDWPLEVKDYKTIDFKNWYKYITESLGDDFCLVEFWIRSNIASVAAFLKMFIEVFNEIAEKQNLDPIPDEYINKL